MSTNHHKKLIVITGGGTGGHVFPALAIAEELKTRGFDLFYIGSSRGLEARLSPERNIPFKAIESGAIKNKGPLGILRSLYLILKASLWSLVFLKRQKASAVVGVGGYVSFPVALAAIMLRIPLFIQEQNVFVGIANSILGKFAKSIFLGFRQAEKYFPKNRCHYTGNPIRKELFLPLPPPPAPPLHVLLFGGSQGAATLNKTFIELLPQIKQLQPNLKITHQTGLSDFENTKNAYLKSPYPDAEILPFIEDMPKAYKACHFVISRSGALTVSELIAVQRPAILVPFPRRGNNDQVENAKWLAGHGTALVVEQGADFKQRLGAAINTMLSPAKISAMASGFGPLQAGNALEIIGDQIESALSTKR